MIATVSPPSRAAEHSLNTLRYAARLKDVGARKAGAGAQERGAIPPSPLTLPAEGGAVADPGAAELRDAIHHAAAAERRAEAMARAEQHVRSSQPVEHTDTPAWARTCVCARL